jgi:hypothetical protein
MKLRKFKKRYWLTTITFILLYYLFIYGPLFPWSPVKSEYVEMSAKTYSLYAFGNGTMIPAYPSLDSYISDTSKTFDLPLNNHIKIIRTDNKHLKNYLPWLNTDSLGGAALQTGDVLYVNAEKIQELGFKEEEYIKHEVIHLMHHQNTNIINSFNAGKVTYLAEGVPFYAAGPNFYSREELLERVKKLKLEETVEGNDIYTTESFSILDEESAERYKVSHMLYGEFIGYLIDTYGREKFNAFNHEYLKTPSIHRQVFDEHYGKKLEVILQEFEENLLR